MKKVVGYNWLHTHPQLEKELNVPNDHVIVDRKDWEEVCTLVKNSDLSKNLDLDKPKLKSNPIIE